MEDNDLAKAAKAVSSWTRVKCKKNGRYLKELAKSKGFTDVSLLNSFYYWKLFAIDELMPEILIR